MMQKLEEMQMKDTLRMFNGLVERCFCECVVSFRSKALTEAEEKCVNTCAEKYMKHAVCAPPLPTSALRPAASHATLFCDRTSDLTGLQYARRDGWGSDSASSRWQSRPHNKRNNEATCDGRRRAWLQHVPG